MTLKDMAHKIEENLEKNDSIILSKLLSSKSVRRLMIAPNRIALASKYYKGIINAKL